MCGPRVAAHATCVRMYNRIICTGVNAVAISDLSICKAFGQKSHGPKIVRTSVRAVAFPTVGQLQLLSIRPTAQC
eukprot:362187-Pleurochrysis_carterae.AAC.1